MKRLVMKLFVLLAMLSTTLTVSAASPQATISVNVLLKQDVSSVVLKQLRNVGTVLTVLNEIDAVTMRIKVGNRAILESLPFVAGVSEDAVRNGAPIDTVAVTDFSTGLSTWDLDAINVTDLGLGRTETYDGTGVYVAVLDTGLVDSWRQYFPQERIAEEYAIAFGGGGGEVGTVSTQKNKWEHDQDSHGTHVTSTILGYNLNGLFINGTAPKATVIPVKVLNQNGSGWSSVIAQGILYVAALKEGPLKNYPVVINMSLGGSRLDVVEKAAIDYAIEAGVIIVASAGNSGEAGMGYPGAYEPVISVAASGWIGEWTAPGSWWRNLNVADPTKASDFYITDFSSRELDGQDLDIAAPGSWIVGPYQVNSGQLGYYFLGGTSMASPHVAGIVALMAQKYPSLTATQAEGILEFSAIPLPAGSRTITNSDGTTSTVSWDDDASGSGIITADAALSNTP
jgi:subtilisin family serine protease